MGRNHKALGPEVVERPHYRRIRNIWYSMKERCKNPRHISYKNYGAIGISVCERWQCLETFYSDVATSYEPGLSLDRIDNTAGYSPENCKWATRKCQANNRRNSCLFTINGKTQTLAQWIDESKVKSSTARQRYYVMKWPIERALGLVR